MAMHTQPAIHSYNDFFSSDQISENMKEERNGKGIKAEFQHSFNIWKVLIVLFVFSENYIILGSPGCLRLFIFLRSIT